MRRCYVHYMSLVFFGIFIFIVIPPAHSKQSNTEGAASYFKVKKSGHYYLKIDSYSIKAYAVDRLEEARLQTNYPVKISRRSGYYAVLIGPLNSLNEVKLASRQLSVPLVIRTPLNNKSVQARPSWVSQLSKKIPQFHLPARTYVLPPKRVQPIKPQLVKKAKLERKPARYLAKESPVIARQGFYIGIGAMANRAQNRINSWGTANGVIPFVIPSNLNETVQIESGFDIPIPNAYNKYQTPVASSGFGPKVTIGYILPSSRKLGVAFQFDATLNSSSKNSFHQNTVNHVLTTAQPKYPSFFQVNEAYLNSYGLSVLPELRLLELYNQFLTQASLLTLVGYRYGIFKSFWEGESVYTGVDIINRKGRNGLELGIGAEVSFSRNLNFRLMTTQTRYQTKTIFTEPAINWAVNSKAEVNEISLSLIWTL